MDTKKNLYNFSIWKKRKITQKDLRKKAWRKLLHKGTH